MCLHNKPDEARKLHAKMKRARKPVTFYKVYRIDGRKITPPYKWRLRRFVPFNLLGEVKAKGQGDRKVRKTLSDQYERIDCGIHVCRTKRVANQIAGNPWATRKVFTVTADAKDLIGVDSNVAVFKKVKLTSESREQIRNIMEGTA